MEIEYRDIPSKPGYRVGSDGSVWSRWKRGGSPANEWRQLATTRITKGGHLRVTIGKPRLVHRLVLESFVGPCPEGMEARHLDGDPTNNSVSNLRWDTHKTNMGDMILHGRTNDRFPGEKSGCAKLTDENVREIRRIGPTLRKYGRNTTLAKQFGVTKSNIAWILSGKHWTHIA